MSHATTPVAARSCSHRKKSSTESAHSISPPRVWRANETQVGRELTRRVDVAAGPSPRSIRSTRGRSARKPRLRRRSSGARVLGRRLEVVLVEAAVIADPPVVVRLVHVEVVVSFPASSDQRLHTSSNADREPPACAIRTRCTARGCARMAVRIAARPSIGSPLRRRRSSYTNRSE